MTKHDADRKARILDFIAATLRTRGFPPSVREIAKAVDASARASTLAATKSSISSCASGSMIRRKPPETTPQRKPKRRNVRSVVRAPGISSSWSATSSI